MPVRPSVLLALFVASSMPGGIGPLRADDPPETDPVPTDDLDIEVGQRDRIEKFLDGFTDAERNQLETPRRAAELLKVQGIVRDRAVLADFRELLQENGLPNDAWDGDVPTDEQRQALVDRRTASVPQTLAYKLVDAYLRIVDERMAREIAATRKIDLRRRPRTFAGGEPKLNFTPEELKVVDELATRFPLTRDGKRAAAINGEIAAFKAWEQLGLQPDPEVQKELDRQARIEFENALRRVPEQQLDRLRALSGIYHGTPAAEEIEHAIHETAKNEQERRGEIRRQVAAEKQRAAFLRAHWDARYPSRTWDD